MLSISTFPRTVRRPSSLRIIKMKPRTNKAAPKCHLIEQAAVSLIEPNLVRDLAALSITTVGSAGLLGTFRWFAMLGLDSKISRKIIHILSGTGFMLCWPLFGDAVYSRLLACIIPLLNGLRILLLGIGFFQDSLGLKSISRTGAREEILRGPFVYVIMLAVMTIAFWRDSPIGIIALSAMCGGDGMADIVGRRLGHLGPLPWNKEKSWIGSLAMFTSTTILSTLLLKFFVAIGTLDLSINILGIVAISLIATLVESLPIPVDDNISVPTAAATAACILL